MKISSACSAATLPWCSALLDALHEKTKGNLAPEEDNLLLDLLGKLKMTFLEINQAVAAEAAKAKARP